MNYKIITFGSASVDIFLKLNRNNFTFARNKRFKNFNKNLCFPFGGKLILKDMEIFSGGGGTNVACGFSCLGFKTAYVGKIGRDAMADIVLKDLKKFNVTDIFVKKDAEIPTPLSVILSAKKDRTILIYKGASHYLKKEEIPFSKFKKAKCFYISPLYGKSADLLLDIIKFARENKIFIAFNPSKQQIRSGKTKLAPALALVDVLILNVNEAKALAKIKGNNEIDIFEELKRLCGGIIVITKGEKGVSVCDGNIIFSARTNSLTKVKEKTGAGDAFASGFVSGLLKKNSIEYAIKLGMANSESVIQETGAKNGLLEGENKAKNFYYNIKKANL